jgi:hypothetical protein
MKIRQRVALLLVAVALAALTGCTQPAGTSGPGATTQPTTPGAKGGY